MDYKTLGRTGLSASVMGLGCGGHSRLGIRQDNGDENAIGIVRRALELGVNFIDTAEQYGTETVVGTAVAGHHPREKVIVSTKVALHKDRGTLRTAPDLKEAAESCLRRLQMEYVDILHLHGVAARDYDYAAAEFVPVLRTLRDEGKIRFLGITEGFGNDTTHRMLVEKALNDDFWDVLMVGFSVLNQSARESVLPITQAKNIGTLDMFAVRRALGNADALKELMENLATKGLLDRADFDPADPLGFIVAGGAAATVPEAAYRFCRYEPGIDIVLSGTGSREHLEANAAALSLPPLPVEIVERLRRLFAGIDSVSGN